MRKPRSIPAVGYRQLANALLLAVLAFVMVDIFLPPGRSALLADSALAALCALLAALHLSICSRSRAENTFETEEDMGAPAWTFGDASEGLTGDDYTIAEAIKEVGRLRAIAERDPLTGLANRGYFEHFVDEHLKRAEANAHHCMMFLDIDGFKQVNDSLGHEEGDRLLSVCSERLQMAAALDDDKAVVEIGRIGGDEFVIFIGDVGTQDVAHRIGHRVLKVLSDSFNLGTHSVNVSASIGVAFSRERGAGYKGLIRAADIAMYQAKRLGRNRLEFYSTAYDEEVKRSAAEEQDLSEALARGQLELQFQPVYDLRTMKISSAEALLRWNHPERGQLAPRDFFPALERANLAPQVGQWVIGEAVRRINDLREAGFPLVVAANVSPLQLESHEFLSLIKSSLQRWDCPPHLLQIEITEDAAMRQVEGVAERLERLSEMGVTLAIDDFGTGYSNLASLTTMPIERLKLDRSLLNDLDGRPEAYVLAQNIINLANSLGFHSVAEGVENERQLQLLGTMGCDLVQGYLLSHPVPFSQLLTMLREQPKPVGAQALLGELSEKLDAAEAA